MTFLETLAQKGVINRYQIDSIVEKAAELDGDFDEAMGSLGIDAAMIRDAKSEFYHMKSKEIDMDSLRYENLQFLPEASARLYRSVVFERDENGTVYVGMVDPENTQATNALQFIFNQAKVGYEIFVISYDDFKQVMSQYSSFGSTTIGSPVDDDNLLGSAEEIQELDDILDQVDNKAKGNTIVEDSPITKTVGVILRNAIDGGVSDIHIEHTADNVQVRFRVDGELHVTYTLPKEARNTIVARVKIMATLRLDEKRKPQDGRFFATVDGRKVDFRVSTMPTFFGEKAVIRILDPGKGISTIENTGMTAQHLKMVREAVSRPYGMILITGPTGSGKSTTLYSLLQEIDRDGKNVISLEDPVEYNIPGVNQSQVRSEIGYSFASGLRSILRQDPDVIMVGEIRDKETAQLAIQAALTGHLVLSTLHTNTSIGAIPRLIDMGVDPYLIAPTLLMTVGQRLVRRIADGAGVETPVESGRKALIEEQFRDLPAQYRDQLPLRPVVYEAQPTDAYPSGTKGRVAVFEMLRIDDDIERLILESPQEQDVYNFARSRGMLTMRDDAMIKCMNGQIPWSEVNKV